MNPNNHIYHLVFVIALWISSIFNLSAQTNNTKSETYDFKVIYIESVEDGAFTTEPAESSIGGESYYITNATVGDYDFTFSYPATTSAKLVSWKSNSKNGTYLEIPGKCGFTLSSNLKDIKFTKVTLTLINTGSTLNTILSDVKSDNGMIEMDDNSLVWTSSDEDGCETMQLEYDHSNSTSPYVQIASINIEYTEQSKENLSEPLISGQTPFLDKTSITISMPANHPEGASVYYTLDGTDPDESSFKFSSPFEIKETTTVRARLIASDMAPGPIASATFYKLKQTATRPTITSSSGAFNFTDGITATLSADDGATIYYTTDGSDPAFELMDGAIRPTGSTMLYSNPVSVTSSLILKAVCITEGFAPSEVTEQVFSKIGVSAMPVIVGSAKFIGSTEISISVPSAPDAEIFYTTDGSTPTTASTLYTGPFSINTTTTIRAIAKEVDKEPGEIAQATFTLITATASIPVINGKKFFSVSTEISIQADAPIYYSFGAEPKFTIDAGGEFRPAEGTFLYSKPFSISQSTTLYAVCLAEGQAPGESISQTYIRLEESASPSILGPEFFADEAQILITASDNAAVFYTTDGTTPTVLFDEQGSVRSGENTLLYGNPIFITASTTVQAIAVEAGKGASPIVSRTFTKAGRAPSPTIDGWSFFDDEATVSISGPGKVYYTTDGSVPNETSTLYASPFVISQTTTVRAVAYADGAAPSQPASLVLKKLEPTERTVEIEGPTEFTDFTTLRLYTSVPTDLIYYTLDGSDPKLFLNHSTGQYECSSPTHNYLAPVGVNRSTTLKVVVVAKGGSPGPVLTKELLNTNHTPAPIISAPAYFISRATVSMTGSGDIFYTTKEEEPTEQSTKYSEPFEITETTTIRAIAKQTDIQPSVIAKFISTRLEPTESTPEIRGAAIFSESTEITIITPTQISAYYTLDGSEPSFEVAPDGTLIPQNGTLIYTEPFTLNETAIITAVAVAQGRAPGQSAKVRFVKSGIVSAPEISGNAFFIASTQVSISADPDAEIRYTLDNSEPTANSQLYQGPFMLSESATVKARAMIDGRIPSAVTERRFVLLSPTPAVVSMEGKRLFAGSTKVILTAPAGCKIFYTTDGREPQLTLSPDGSFEISGATMLYQAPIEISETTMITAVALADGYAPGEASKEEFRLTDYSTPVRIVGASFFITSTTITLTASEDAAIYFTLDGSEPSEDSQAYVSPIKLENTALLRAIAIQPGKLTSEITEQQFVKLAPTGGDISMEGDRRFLSATEVVLKSSIGADIYYTLSAEEPRLTLQPDGTFKPDEGTFLYSAPIQITQTTTISARPLAKGAAPGSVVSQQFVLASESEPVVISGDRFFTDYTDITLTAAKGASIYYTLDGSKPDQSSSPYQAPIRISVSTLLRAIAVEPERAPSQPEGAQFTLLQPTSDGISIEGDSRFSTSTNIRISGPDDCEIYYTINGSQPMLILQPDGSFIPADDTFLYVDQFRISTSSIVKAVALRRGMAPGATVAAEFVKSDTSDSPEITGNRYFLETTTATLTAGKDAVIYYTIDGSAPTERSTRYTAPVSISSSLSLRAIAIQSGCFASLEVQAEFVRLEPTEAEVLIEGERNFISSATITLSAPGDCRIYFTTSGADPVLELQQDGSFKPGEGTVLYDNAFTISRTSIISAVAVGALKAPGKAARAEFVRSANSDNVRIDGPRYFIDQATISMSAAEGATIFYTTDGAEPTQDSEAYSAPFLITSTTTIRAIAIESGKLPSETAQLISRRLEQTATVPTLADGSTSAVVDEGSDIELIAPGCAIYYTVNGTSPTLLLQSDGSFKPLGSAMLYSQPIHADGPFEIRAVALAEGFAPGAEARIQISMRDISTAPEIIGNAFFVDSHSVRLSAPGAIYYTLDGSMPTQATGTPYTTPITLTSDTHLRAIAIEDGKRPSADAERHFTALARTDTPELPEGMKFANSTEIEIKAPAGTEIYYMTDGSDPVFTIEADGSINMAENCLRYTAPIAISQTTHISAVALRPGRAPSQAVGATYVRDDSSGIGTVAPEQAGVRISGRAIYAPEGSRIFDTAGFEYRIGQELARGIYIVRTPSGVVKLRL